jgi:hypothetical protein
VLGPQGLGSQGSSSATSGAIAKKRVRTSHAKGCVLVSQSAPQRVGWWFFFKGIPILFLVGGANFTVKITTKNKMQE